MTASDRKAATMMRRAGLCLLSALLATVSLAAVACAQGAPTQLTPPSRITPAPSATTPDDAPRAGSGYQVEELQALSGESFGTLDGNAGLGLDLWRGTRRSQMVELMTVMPGATRSYAMNALARRVLLTTATVPPAEPGSKGPNLLTLRSQRLAALGRGEDIAALIAAAPRRVEDEGLLRLSVDANLIGGDHAAACKQARAAGGDFNDAYWRKVTIFCQIIVGEKSQANLGAALMREQDPKGEATFHALLRAIEGDKTVKIAKLPSPSPLDIAMLNAAKLPIPDDTLETQNAAMLAAFARNDGLPIDKRIAVAERAESLGTLPTAEVAQIYSAMKFTPAQVSNALAEAGKIGGARGRALLFVAQGSQSNPAARAELLRQAFVSARAAGLYATALRLYSQALKDIPASDDIGWFAGEAARAYFALGQPLDARAWLSAGRSFRPAAGAEHLSADVATFPYELIASEKAMAWDAGRYQRWVQAQGKDASVKATTLLVLLEGLDRAAPDEAWDGLARVQIDPAANLPSPAVLRRLEVASATERRGPAVLAALITLGDEGPAGCHPIVLGMAIAGLRYLGLEPEARALALDAIVGAGF